MMGGSLNTVGIGKIIVDNTDPDWNYPHFHVVVYQEDDEDIYFAYCMELGIDAYSEESAENAFYNIADNILMAISFFDDVDTLFKSLMNIAESEHNNVFWREYRIIETKLARCAKDLGSKLIDNLIREIEKLRRKLNESHDRQISVMDFTCLINSKVA